MRATILVSASASVLDRSPSSPAPFPATHLLSTARYTLSFRGAYSCAGNAIDVSGTSQCRAVSDICQQIVSVRIARYRFSNDSSIHGLALLHVPWELFGSLWQEPIRREISISLLVKIVSRKRRVPKGRTRFISRLLPVASSNGQ